MKKKLDRTLGLFSVIAIGVGGMIGSAIFVLVGVSYSLAGPAASLSVILAGVAIFFTAFSFAELVTVIPETGGGYTYIKEATNNGALAFIAGWCFWLGYALVSGLFAIGFGNFLNYFFPFVPPLVGAYGLILYVMMTNIKGIENMGKLQNIITTILVVILGGYIGYGYFHMDISKQIPFFSEGLGGVFYVTMLIYITYIGFDLVTAVSEEVIEPEKTIPKGIIISMMIAIFLKFSMFFIGAGIICWRNLVPSVTKEPLTLTAVEMFGSIGGYLFALAGICATVSSINTTMLASSRISYAMSRDNHLPAIFKNINAHTKTPIFSVLAVGFIVIISTSIRDLEMISGITSLFVLIGYSMVNVALIILRKKRPEIKRAYEVPFYPLTPLAAIGLNGFLLVQLMLNNPAATIFALIIMLSGVLYYYYFLPKLKTASKSISVQSLPSFPITIEDAGGKYKVLVPVSSPLMVEDLINVGLKIASSSQGIVQPVHIVEVPEIIPADADYDDFILSSPRHKRVLDHVNRIAGGCSLIAEPLLVMSHHTIPALKKVVLETAPDLVILGWHPSNFAYRMLSGFVYRAMQELPANIGIFKKGQNTNVTKILYPYGGGMHSRAVAGIVKRLSQGMNAAVTFFHIVDKETPQDEIAKIRDIMVIGLKDLEMKGDVIITESDSVAQAIVEESEGHDLVVMGASYSWGIANNITGMKTDRIMEKIACNGLVVRQYEPLLKQKFLRRMCNYLKELLLD